MNKKTGLVLLSLAFVLSISLVFASAENFKVDIKNYGQCVSNSTKTENICFKETRMVFNTCKLKVLKDLKNNSINKSEYKISVKECQESLKNNTNICIANFKTSKENCLIFKCDYNQTDKRYLNITPSQCKYTEVLCGGGFAAFFDSCGCGCKESKPKICEDYKYSICSEKCEKRCVPSVCNGEVCTDDCEGVGSCFTPNKYCYTNNDCKENEFCELKEGACLLRCDVSDSRCLSKGKCEKKPKACPYLYKPVCGCDGKTYGNDCERKVSGIPKAKDDACNKKECKELNKEILNELKEVQKCNNDSDCIINELNLPCSISLCETAYNKNSDLNKILNLSKEYIDSCREICSMIACRINENDLPMCENNKCQIKEIKENYCRPEQRNIAICPTFYHPVCGWFNSSIQCFKYPCAQDFSNSCIACLNENVLFWTKGECPKSKKQVPFSQ